MRSDTEDSVNANGRLIDQKPAYDKIMNTKVALQLDEKVVSAQVKHQALVPERNIFGRCDVNPMLKFMIYKI